MSGPRNLVSAFAIRGNEANTSLLGKETDMTAGSWFWAVLVLSVIFGFAPCDGPNARYWGYGRNLVWIALFALLGYAVFSGPIKG